MFKKTFTWWNGATIGTHFTVWRRGRLIGEDQFGNRYYQARDKKSYDGRSRRWVIYNGYADASKVPAEWHGWLHYSVDEPPTTAPFPERPWMKSYVPNMSGTPFAWRPKGSILRSGERPRATGDYQAWRPD